MISLLFCLNLLKGGERMELYNCFSQRLAGFILMNGFPMHSIRIDSKNDGRNVYLFRDGELLRNIIKNYKK